MMIDLDSIQKSLGAPLKLIQPLVSCYGKQILTHALFLESGEIMIDKGRAGTQKITQPGLYFYDEFLNEKMINFHIEVSAGSKVWILTKSELSLLTNCALPA